MRKLKIVYANALGWRVQVALLKHVASQGDRSIGIQFVPYSTPLPLRPFLKDTYGIGFPKRLNLMTSLSVARSIMCRSVAQFEADDNVIFMGGNSLGLLAHAPKNISPIVVTDMTAALAARLFGAKFGAADIAEERYFLERCRKVFAMSTACARSLSTDYGLLPDRIELYLPPVHAPPQRKGLLDGPVRVGFVGGDFRRKGGELLLKAYREFSLSRVCNLVIVSEKCESVREAGVIVHGRLLHSEITSNILPNLDIFCLPTLQDCSGIAIAEALSAGLPVIATDLPGIADLVAHEETGLIVPPNDAESIGKAITRLVEDTELRMRLSRQAFIFASENFRAEKKLEQLVAEFY